jgi:hypothetical protein
MPIAFSQVLHIKNEEHKNTKELNSFTTPLLLLATMAIHTDHMKTEKTFVTGGSEKSPNVSEVKIRVTNVRSHVASFDLLDLLDEHFLPKDHVKSHGRRRISILDVMPSPELVKERIEVARKFEAEERKKKSRDLLDFLDKRTYLPRKDVDDNNVPSRRLSVLDVMDPPPSFPHAPAKMPMDLVNLLDSKTWLPLDSRIHSGRRRISILDILEKQRH